MVLGAAVQGRGLGEGESRETWHREGGENRCGQPITGSPCPRHLPPCLGPPALHSYTYIPACPPPHSPLPDSLSHLSVSLSFTHTHPSVLCGLTPPHTPSHTLTVAKSESRGVGLNWKEQTPLQIGPFPWVSFEACHVRLQGGCLLGWSGPLSVTGGSVGKWESRHLGQAGAAAPGSR